MDFRKLKHFKCINHRRTRKVYNYPETSPFAYRYYESQYKDQLGRTGIIYHFRYFPYCDEIEQLYKTTYEYIFPFAKFNVDFLLHQGDGKQIEELVSKCFDDNDIAQDIANHISIYFTINSTLNKEIVVREDPVFSFFLMNAYVHQNKIDSYGDFIESEGDRVYDEQFCNLDLPIREHTYDIFNLFKEVIGYRKYSSVQCFTVGSRTTKKIIDLFKSISQEEMLKIIKEYSSTPNDLCSTFSSQYILVDSILEKIRNNEAKVTKIEVLDKISEIFIQLMSKTDKKYTLQDISQLALQLDKFNSFIVDNVTKASSSKIYSNRIYKILQVIDENINEIQVEEFMALIKTLMSNHECFMRSGNNDKMVELLELALNSSESDLINFVNIIGETLLYHVKNNDNLVPTYSDWKKELTKDDKDLTIPYSLLIAMIAKEKKDDTLYYYYEIEEIKKFKKLVLQIG